MKRTSVLQPITLVGVLFIIVGVLLVALPLLGRSFPSLENLPWIILWVYKRDGFYFATSPLLIIISAVSVIVSIIVRNRG